MDSNRLKLLRCGGCGGCGCGDAGVATKKWEDLLY